MKRVLPLVLLPLISIAYAQSHNSNGLESMLTVVSEEAAKTQIDNKVTVENNTGNEPLTPSSDPVDMDEMTQSIASRLTEILGTQQTTPSNKLSSSIENIVSNALKEGKQMDEIRNAVSQAMQEVTGQQISLSPDVEKIEPETPLQTKTATDEPESPPPSLTPSTTAQSEPEEDALSEEAIGIESEPLPDTATVLAGESLFRLAQRIYGEENGRRFLELFEANKDVIKDINILYEGQVLKVPK